MQEPKKGSIMK